MGGEWREAWRLYKIMMAVDWKWSLQQAQEADEAMLDKILMIKGLVMNFEMTHAAEAKRNAPSGT